MELAHENQPDGQVIFMRRGFFVDSAPAASLVGGFDRTVLAEALP